MFSVNYKDPRPIYEQVKDSLRKSILAGILSPDEKIPSVREAASQLAINPNTIQKAYRELESEGYVYSVPGKGSFVSDCVQARSQREKELFDQLDTVAGELVHIGVSMDKICSHLSSSAAKEESK